MYGEAEETASNIYESIDLQRECRLMNHFSCRDPAVRSVAHTIIAFAPRASWSRANVRKENRICHVSALIIAVLVGVVRFRPLFHPATAKVLG